MVTTKTTPKTPKVKVLTQKELLDSIIVNAVTEATKKFQKAHAKVLKAFETKKIPPKKSKQRIKEEKIVDKIFSTCSDYRDLIIQLLAVIWDKDPASYRDHLYKIYKDKDKKPKGKSVKISPFALIRPIANTNSHDYPLNEISIMYSTESALMFSKSRDRVTTGNHITTDFDEVKLLTTKEVSDFIKSETFVKFRDRIMAESSLKTKLIETLE